MFCTKCGNKLEDNQRKCPYCGSGMEKLNVADKSILQYIKENWEKFFATVMVVIGIVIVICVFSGNKEEQYIEEIRQACPENFSDITFEDAFGQYFSNGEWSYEDLDDEEYIVEFKGTRKDNSGEKTKMRIQFKAEEDDKDFEIYRMYVDGFKLSEEAMELYLWSVFNEYDE